MEATWVYPQPLRRVVDQLRSGSLDLDVYVDEFCDRIERAETDVHAYVEEPARRERLHAEAAELKQRWSDTADRPPLFGVPVAVKDIVRVDGLPTQAGSRVPPEALAGPQAVVVDRLRGAGALVAGKSVTAEFAHFAPGQTRNPHELTRTPGGSSSGSAAAVAAGTALLATGTQTVGSVVRPAAFCGVVGWKSTHGRVPKDGVIDHSPSLDALGMFAADVDGVTTAARALCHDWSEPPAVDRLVLGLLVGEYLDQVEVEALIGFSRQLDALRRAGHKVIDVPFADLLGPYDVLLVHNLTVNRYELAATHEKWFDEHRERYRPETAAGIERGRSISDSAYAEAHDHLDQLRAGLDDRFADAGVDVLVAPSAIGAAPVGIESTGDPAMALPWTYAGVPAVSLPGATTAVGLPLGFQLIAPAGADEALLAAAATLEPVLGA